MDLLNQIRESFPKTIDKTKPVFSSIVANENKNASIQKQLIDLFAYMKEWTSTPNVYEQTGEMLMKTVTFFSFLDRFVDETEKSLKNRFRAIFVRNHDQKWGTPFDVKNVFHQYFPHATIYLVENTNQVDSIVPGMGNLITDGDIETATPEDWTLSDCDATERAKFSKTYGFEMDDAGGYFYQAITDLPNRRRINDTEPYEYENITYFLHFFMSGNTKVSIKDTTNSKWWDSTSREWKSSEVFTSFSTAEWNDCSMWFRTQGDDDTINLQITFYYPDTLLKGELDKTFVKGLLPVTWTKTDCTTTVEDNRTVINLIQDSSEVSTTVSIMPGQEYKLNFAYKVLRTFQTRNNNLYVVVKNNNNKYWNFETGRWGDSEYKNPFTSTVWVRTTQNIVADANSSSLTITFEYDENTSYLDENIKLEGAVATTRTLTDCTITNGVINLPQKTSKASYAGTVNASQSYSLNYKFKGRLAVIVKNDNNQYWDFSSRRWVATQKINEYFSNKVVEKELVIDGDANTTQLSIDFEMIPNYLDYFRLFAKQKYSSFTVIVHFDGNTAANVFGLAAGESDPNIEDSGDTPPQPRYSRYGYYDKSYLSGVPAGFAVDIYDDLMDYLRAQGVKAYLEFVIRDIEI